MADILFTALLRLRAVQAVVASQDTGLSTIPLRITVVWVLLVPLGKVVLGVTGFTTPVCGLIQVVLLAGAVLVPWGVMAPIAAALSFTPVMVVPALPVASLAQA
jgi:hypothetical protein